MTECWPDGALRAHIDHELPPDEAALLSAHLERCEDCRLRRDLLETRSRRVLDLVFELSEPATAPVVARRPMPLPAPRSRRNFWIAAVAALAAVWAAVVLLTPKSVEAPPAPYNPPMQAAIPAPPPPAVPAQQAPAESVDHPAPVRLRQSMRPPAMPRAGRAFPAAPQRVTLAGFVPLDDEPIDDGVVMRVALAAGQMQADVVYSPDGRPRAIRLVSGPAGAGK